MNYFQFKRFTSEEAELRSSDIQRKKQNAEVVSRQEVSRMRWVKALSGISEEQYDELVAGAKVNDYTKHRALAREVLIKGRSNGN